MHARGDQPGDVRHVDQEPGADRVGDRPEAGEVDEARIGRGAGDDHLGLVLVRQPLDLLEVDQPVLLAHAVLHRLEPLARHGGLGAVGEMAAGIQGHAEDGVAGREQGQLDRTVGLGAGVRLDVGEAAVEQALGAVDRERLGDVDMLAAAIVAFARIAFRVLVGQHRALRLEHGAADDVLAGDQLDLVLLAAELGRDGGREVRIGLGERAPEEAGPALLGGRPPLLPHLTAAFAMPAHSRKLPNPRLGLAGTLPCPGSAAIAISGTTAGLDAAS